MSFYLSGVHSSRAILSLQLSQDSLQKVVAFCGNINRFISTMKFFRGSIPTKPHPAKANTYLAGFIVSGEEIS